MFNLRQYLRVLLITMMAISGQAQYSFVNYDYTNDLPLDEIVVITEDSLGYIWLGGPSGLARFDGRNFTHYIKGKRGSNVAGNIVNDIDVISRDKILISYDDNGISIYDHADDSFKSRVYNKDDNDQFPKHSIFSAFVANDSLAYLCANREGLYQMNLNTLHTKKLEIGKIPRDVIQHPFKTDRLLFTYRGLWELDEKSLEIKRLSKEGTSGLKIIDDEVWFNGYTHKIFNYNLKSTSLTEYKSDYAGVVRGWSMVDGDLWVGLAEGLEVIDTSFSEVIHTYNTKDENGNFSGDFIYEVYKDSKDRVWIASDKGLNMYDPRKPIFEKSSFLPNQSTFLDKLTDDTFLSLDFYGNTVEYIDSKEHLQPVTINGKLRGPLHTVRVAEQLLVVFFNGIGYYDSSNYVIHPYQSPFTVANKRGLTEVISVDDKLIGIYRHENTIINWDVNTNEIDTIKTSGEPKTIIDTQDGNVWVSGVGFLCKYDFENNKAEHISLEENYYDELAGVIVKIDKAHSAYWACTRINGTWKVSLDNGEFKLLDHYSNDEGLNNNIVYSYTNENENLFVQSRAGLHMYNEKLDRFIDIGQSRNLFLQNLFSVSVWDSTLYVLGYKNFTFDLTQLDNQKEIPKPYLKKILVNGKPRYVDDEKLSLDYDENTISMMFDVVYFDLSSQLNVRYRLSNLDEWVYPTKVNSTIHFASLAADNYRFELSTSIGDGQWTTPLVQEFEIKAPYWKTWWFLLLLMGILGLIVYAIYKFRMKQLEKIHSMGLKLAELESESLRAQMNPHFVFNALNSIKSYIIKNKKEEAADYLTTFSELIRAVLRNSTRKEISLQDEIEALGLYLQIENLRLNQKFEYNLVVDDNINAASVAFPPLIIQPFVENSIWHGFTNKKSKGLLEIKVKKDASNLIVTITDDGIGREASKKIEKSRERKRSYGIAITKTRLHNILNQGDIKIKDLYSEQGESIGTQVIMRLPFKLLDNTIENND